METKVERLQNDLETLATFTATPGKGVTRSSYSKEDTMAKNYLIDEAKKLGLEIIIDGFGTIFARKEGKIKDAPAVMFGSHYDSVVNGGAFDGAAGTVAALEVMRVLHENNFENDLAMQLWTALLDKGYHICATYGRDWHRPSNSNGHYGCTYLHYENGVATEQGTLRAIRLGKTVVSTGAKLIFRVHRLGKTYGLGSTIPKGNVTFSFFTDLHSREKNAGEEAVEYETVRIVSNGGKTVLEARCDERHARLKIEAGRWYRAELWGTVNGKRKILAVTSPVYCE